MLYQLFVFLLGVSRWLVLVLRLGSAEYGRPFHSSGRLDVCHSKLVKGSVGDTYRMRITVLGCF
jgi:hypothetical protein